jgi:hypothetical protein
MVKPKLNKKLLFDFDQKFFCAQILENFFNQK